MLAYARLLKAGPIMRKVVGLRSGGPEQSRNLRPAPTERSNVAPPQRISGPRLRSCIHGRDTLTKTDAGRTGLFDPVNPRPQEAAARRSSAQRPVHPMVAAIKTNITKPRKAA